MSDQQIAENSASDFVEETVDTNEELSTESQHNEESAASTEQEQEKRPEITPEAQKIIAEKAFAEREAKREAKELKQRLEAIEKANAPQAPQAGSKPDRWEFDSDEDFNRALDDYAGKQAELKLYEYQQQQAEQAALQQQQSAQIKQQQELEQVAKTYMAKAEELGIDRAELEQAGKMVAAYNLGDAEAMHILNDPEGALVTKYLAANPHQIEALNNADTFSKGVVYAEIKQAASALRAKISSDAPAPADIAKGGSVPADENPWGATFE